MDAQTLDPMIGRTVDDRYEVVARVARGGMATVYRAVDRRLDRTVAVKVMHPHLAESPEFVARFRREARAAARLSHPGAVAVHDQGMAGDASYLTMEYVEGPNLREVLRRRGALPLGEALELVDAVLDALAAAHRAGLIHRDVKPENVLITPEGRPKVADFGLARAVSEATAASTGSVLGTVAYLAPEIVTDGVADARADVYACGVLLYELITGAQPFTGETPIQVAFQHVNSTVPLPSAVVAWLPAEVDELVAALTARDPEERAPDAVAARELLRRCRHSLDAATMERRADVAPAPAGPPAGTGTGEDRTDEVSVPADEAPTRSTPVRHGTVALPIGAIPREEQAPPQTAARARPRRRLWALLLALLAALLVAAAALWWFQAGPGAYTATPDVVGMGETQASEALQEHGLATVVERAHHDTVPEGEVIATDPGPGEQVRREGEVTLSVSLGILMLEVPDVLGLPQGTAEENLESTGLPVGEVRTDYSDDVPEGAVISTDPAAGESVPHTTAVDLLVSAGREPVEITDVTGQERAAAVAALEDAGVQVEVEEAYSDDVPAGQVVSQSPGAGADLYRGDTVELTVSLGPELFEVPDVVGDQVAEARSTLEDAGFQVQVEEVLGGFFGTVRAMDPDAGQRVRAGTTITITVV